MEYNTKEMLIKLRVDDILLIKPQEDCTGYTTEGTEHTIANMQKALNSTPLPKAILIWTPSFYVKKEIINYYSTSEFNEVAVAIASNSYISRFVASIALKMRERFTSSGKTTQNAPVKIFSKETEAAQWLLEKLAAHKS